MKVKNTRIFGRKETFFKIKSKVLKKKQKQQFFNNLKQKSLYILIALIFLCLIGLAVYQALVALIYKNPEYSVENIIVSGNKKLSSEKIIELSEIKEGMNIFRFDIYRAKKRVEKAPLVEKVTITRRLPHTIIFEVVERKAKAKLGGTRQFLVDLSGVILPYSIEPHNKSLPTIKGMKTTNLQVGDKCEDIKLKKALKILQLCESSDLINLIQIEQIDVRNPNDVYIYLKEGVYTNENCKIRLGGGDFNQRLANFIVILKNYGSKIKTIDLTLKRIPAT